MSTDRRRAPAGYSYDPCQGCGSDELRLKGRLCSVCSTKLREADEIMKQRDERGGQVVRLIPNWPQDMPYVATHEPPGMGFEERRELEIRPVFQQLAMLLSEPAPDGVRYSETPLLFVRADRPSEYGRSNEPRQIPEGVAELLAKLFRLHYETIERAFERGREKGTNLLMSLASGELTTREFNDRAIGGK